MAPSTTLGNTHPPCGSPGGSSAGFSYVAVLLMVLLLSLALAMAAEPLATSSQRDKEAELLFIGDQYRNAIASYYKSAPDGLSVLPMKLEDLVLDKRFIAPRHHLRRLYADPMTASQQWGLIKNPQDQLMGVYSLAAGTPLLMPFITKPDIAFGTDLTASMEPAAANAQSQDGINSGWQAPVKAASYADWKFVFMPKQENSQSVAPAANNGNIDSSCTLSQDAMSQR